MYKYYCVTDTETFCSSIGFSECFFLKVIFTKISSFDVFQAVFRGTERIAAEITKAYENKQSESAVDNNDNVEVVDQEIVIANWDWLDFGDGTEVQ